MKRLIPASLLVLALGVSACGGDETASTPEPIASTQAGKSTSLRVAGTDGRTGDATSASSEDGVENLAKEAKITKRVRDKTSNRQAVGAGAACTSVDLLPEEANLPLVQAATLCLLNGERADKGLKPLVENAKLAQSSLAHSKDMVENSYFAHDGRNGSDVVDRVKVTGYLSGGGRWSVGENLAWGTGTLASPRGIVNSWMNSPGHRDNILRGDYEEIGFGIVIGNPRSSDGSGATFTTNFGVVEGGPSSTPSATPTGTATPEATVQAARRAINRRLRTCRARARTTKRKRACASIARRARASVVRR